MGVLFTTRTLNSYTSALQYHLNGEGLDLPYHEVESLLVDYEQAGLEPVADSAQTAVDVINWMSQSDN